MKHFILRAVSLLALVPAAGLYAVKKTIIINSIINQTDLQIKCTPYRLETKECSSSTPPFLQSTRTDAVPDRAIIIQPKTTNLIKGTLTAVSPTKVEQGHEKIELVFFNRSGQTIGALLAFGRKSYFDAGQKKRFDGAWIEVAHRDFSTGAIEGMGLNQIGTDACEGGQYDIIFEDNLLLGITYNLVPVDGDAS